MTDRSVNAITDFESGMSLSGDTTDYEFLSSFDVPVGSEYIRHKSSGDAGNSFVYFQGTNGFPSSGDVFSIYVYPESNNHIAFRFFITNETFPTNERRPECIEFDIAWNRSTPEVNLAEITDGTRTTLGPEVVQNLPSDEWIQLELDNTTTNDITIRIFELDASFNRTNTLLTKTYSDPKIGNRASSANNIMSIDTFTERDDGPAWDGLKLE
jgi:hypothetical protein